MTDEEWERAEDTPVGLHSKLWWVLRTLRASPRKQRLFACACCRRGWDLFPAEAWQAVVVAEQFADRRAANSERAAVYKAVARLVRANKVVAAVRHAVAPMKDGYSSTRDVWQTASIVADAVVKAHVASAGTPAGAEDPGAGYVAVLNREVAAQHRILACHFPNPDSVFPYRLRTRPVEIQDLAEAAYEERVLPSGRLDHARLVVLADALEEAGAAAQILAHLRRPEAHYRGCWALDLALGKEVPWTLRAGEVVVERHEADME